MASIFYYPNGSTYLLQEGLETLQFRVVEVLLNSQAGMKVTTTVKAIN